MQWTTTYKGMYLNLYNLEHNNKNCASISIDSPATFVRRTTAMADTVKPVCNDHLYRKIHYLWFSQ